MFNSVRISEKISETVTGFDGEKNHKTISFRASPRRILEKRAKYLRGTSQFFHKKTPILNPQQEKYAKKKLIQT